MDIKTLQSQVPQIGRVEWIGLRPAKWEDLEAVQEAVLDPEHGITGDHYSGRSGKRQVTLIQQEHLEAVSKLMGKGVDPTMTRRNIVVSGINLAALKKGRFRIGGVLLEGTGDCHPCTRMEKNLGVGGYQAMRGHGGITARVIEGGLVQVSDPVTMKINDQ